MYRSTPGSAIIPKEIFNRTKAEMACRAIKRKVMQKHGKAKQGKYSAKYALTDLLACGECSSPYKRCTWLGTGKSVSYGGVSPGEFYPGAKGLTRTVECATIKQYIPVFEREPNTIINNGRILPIGYWKGAGTAIAREYTIRFAEEALFETHDVHFGIQCVVFGKERFGV